MDFLISEALKLVFVLFYLRMLPGRPVKLKSISREAVFAVHSVVLLRYIGSHRAFLSIWQDAWYQVSLKRRNRLPLPRGDRIVDKGVSCENRSN